MANKISSIAPVTAIQREVTKARDIEGHALSITAVKFRKGSYRGKENTSAWITCYDLTAGGNEITTVCSGWKVVEQLTIVERNGGFPVECMLVKNEDENGSWELQDISEETPF